VLVRGFSGGQGDPDPRRLLAAWMLSCPRSSGPAVLPGTAMNQQRLRDRGSRGTNPPLRGNRNVIALRFPLCWACAAWRGTRSWASARRSSRPVLAMRCCWPRDGRSRWTRGHQLAFGMTNRRVAAAGTVRTYVSRLRTASGAAAGLGGAPRDRVAAPGYVLLRPCWALEPGCLHPSDKRLGAAGKGARPSGMPRLPVLLSDDALDLVRNTAGGVSRPLCPAQASAYHRAPAGGYPRTGLSLDIEPGRAWGRAGRENTKRC